MGLSNASFGLYSGIAFFAIPQVLATHHVTEARIAAITAMALSPNFWAVMFGPMLDVRFSRRWYATLFAALAAVLVLIAVMNLGHLVVLEVALVLGSASAILSTTALGGWLSSVCPKADENKLSAWFNLAYICASGFTMIIAGEFIRHLPLWIAAVVLAAIVFLPATIFLLIPAPGPDRRLGRRKLHPVQPRDLHPLASPGSADHAAALPHPLRFVRIDQPAWRYRQRLQRIAEDGEPGRRSGGHRSRHPRLPALSSSFPADAAAPSLSRQWNIRRPFYAEPCCAAPRPWTFVLALFGEFLFQAVSYTGTVALAFETIGQDNPLAATTFTFLIAATNVPVAYMLYLDGRAYGFGGVRGSFAADAIISIVVCLLIGFILSRLQGEAFGSGIPVMDPLLPDE
jgi:PAT family beta-lactamase induction signal transducer AmpG